MDENRPQHLSKYDRTNDHVFKEYKRYKRKNPRPDYNNVIDFTQPDKYAKFMTNIKLQNVDRFSPHHFCKIGLKHPKQWLVYELNACPGFIVVLNAFCSPATQSYWVKQALTNYTKKPYPCNLDGLMELDKEKCMWTISKEKSLDNSFINQLRWVHMGYHFDYNTVDYKEKQYFGFPEDLAYMTSTIADVFQFENYVAETGIINYYPEGSSMGGHTDHYEEELHQPLIAYSFGQSAIYLIGGATRDVKPEAIWVRSGDIMLMTGPSRTAFHAVPCILTKPVKTAPSDIGTCPLALYDSDSDVIDEREKKSSRKIINTLKYDHTRTDKNKCLLSGKETRITLENNTDERCSFANSINTDVNKQIPNRKESPEINSKTNLNLTMPVLHNNEHSLESNSTDHLVEMDTTRFENIPDASKHEQSYVIKQYEPIDVHIQKDVYACGCDSSQHIWKDEMREIDSWREFSDYIKSTRININIRQVHKYKPSE